MSEGRYGTSNSAVIWDWMERTADPDRREAFLRWLGIVSRDPHEACHAVVAKGRREVCVAHVPLALVRVSYLVFDTPARAVHFIEISDDGFDPSYVHR